MTAVFPRAPAVFIVAIGLLPPLLACAAPAWEIEADPTAFALHGYSAHLGYAAGPLRIDLGAYGTDIPRRVHGNDRFHAAMRGYGIKAQFFLSGHTEGWFSGAGLGHATLRVRADDSGLRAAQPSASAGAESGYRFQLGPRFHLTAWGGVDYVPHARDIQVGASTYENRRLQPFAAVHLGYRF
jgi:hypothetical protein